MNNATGLYCPDGMPDLAHESCTYLGDQANMPYGDYVAEGKSDYLRELILKAEWINILPTVYASLAIGAGRKPYRCKLVAPQV